MNFLNALIARTIKPFLLVFGLATCATLPMAVDMKFLTSMMGGVVDYTPSSVPALRHWAFMVFGIGALMIVAGLRPWLRFETMLFSAAEKGFMVFLFLSNVDEPWITGYRTAFLVDSTIVVYSILYFVSDQGRPEHWKAMQAPQ